MNVASIIFKTCNMPTITPITHATAIISWEDTVIYADPTGEEEAFAGRPTANIIIVTDIHGDHFDVTALEAVIGEDTSLVVPKVVMDELPSDLATRAHVLGNGESITLQGVAITAIPMYNLPESPDSKHPKGRGNGYVLERNGVRVYVGGDTSGIPEMRALKNIDIALVPMNLPYTMSVEEAAEAVLDFKPKAVYPYHYRGIDGLADVEKFKQLVHAGDSAIDVVQLNWYPEE